MDLEMGKSIDEIIYCSAGRVVTRRIGEDRLLVPVSGGVAMENAVFPVNETALFVWEQLTEEKTILEIAEKMTTVFEVNLETAQVDCEEITQTFLEQGLLKGR